ncbi:MAG TPA: type III pantothenate kinase [Usitatibacter sp.]|nr:type III pantothenate kinase [Usitatibacter sp.]
MSAAGPQASLLAIDAGNTRIKWGLHDGHGWAATGSVATADSATLHRAWHGAALAPRAIACNVAGGTVEHDLQSACERRGIALQVVRSSARAGGVTNSYRDPAQLGADRWAALIGAHALAAEDVLVVNAGTALTIDALTREGRFLGGLIVPGPAMMRKALDRGTAGLRLTEGHFADFPQSTPDAITTGAAQAAIGAILRMASAMERQGSAPARVLLSGGAAAEIGAHLPLPASMHENLVLDGLLVLARPR